MYLYDASDFHRAIMSALRRNSDFMCVVIMDREQVEKNTCSGTRDMATELKDNGASIFLAQGRRRGKRSHAGSFHMKSIVVDKRVAYVGSANMTNASSSNVELMTRMTGPPVHDVLHAVLEPLRNATQF
jgi:phosphatidylserine/phosphatidylglycerophosphate/cardiolipin synthase-like enzyme